MKRLLVLLMALAMLTGCNISGVVTDSEGNGLEGVAVELSGDASLMVTTDVDGNYTFEDVDRGSYTVTPSLDGYAFDPGSRDLSLSMKDAGSVDFTATLLPRTVSGFIAVPDGSGVNGVTVELSGDTTYSAVTTAGNFVFNEVVQGDYTLRPVVDNHIIEPLSQEVSVDKSDITGLTFSIRPMPSVSGVIAGASGAGITVELRGETIRNVTTEEDGSYLFKHVAAGDYTVTPYCPGYLFEPSIADITVVQDDVTANFVSTMAPRTVSGSVVDESGQPVSGAIVELSGPESKITTTGNGQFRFTDVRQGQYSVSVTLAGYTVTPQTQTITVGMQDVSGVQFTAKALPSISGVVWDDKKKTLCSGLMVKLSGDATRSVITDADGRYEFTGLNSGTYTVSMPLTLYHVAPQQFEDGVVTIGQNDVSLDIHIWKYPVVSGFVRTVDTLPIAGVTVELQGDTTYRTTTNDNGLYVFHRFPIGTYKVVPVLPGYVIERSTPAEDGIVTAYQDDIKQHFFMRALPVIHGQVWDDKQNRPLDGVTVELRGSDGSVLTVATSSMGEYLFDKVVADTYTIKPLLDGHLIKTLKFEPEGPVEVSEIVVDREDIELRFEVRPMPVIHGQLWDDKQNRPLDGVTVELRGSDGSVRTVTTGSMGEYLFDKVVADTYTIKPLLDGHLIKTLKFEPEGPVEVSEIVVDREDIELRFEVRPMPVIHGQLWDDKQNRPLDGVTVELRGSDGSIRTVTTSSMGEYLFDKVVADTYTIKPLLDGHLIKTLKFEPEGPVEVSEIVVDREDIELRFEVRPMPVIHGQLWDDKQNRPLDGVTVELRGSDGSVRTVTTSSMGEYLFDKVVADTYTIKPLLDGHLIKTLKFEPEGPVEVSEIVVDREDIELRFEVRPMPVIHGQLWDDKQNRPLDGVTVELRGSDGSVRTVTTGSMGEYLFDKVVADTYTIKPLLDGHLIKTLKFEPEGPVEVSEIVVDREDIELRFEVRPMPVIHGQLWDDKQNRPLDGVTVELRGSDGSVRTVTTGSMGEYLFDKVVADTYTIKPLLDGHLIKTLKFEPEGPVEVSEIVVDREDIELRFEVRWMPLVSGRIWDSKSNTYLRGVTVELHGNDGSVRSFLTDDFGTYRFWQVTPGTYTVIPLLEGYAITPHSLSPDGPIVPAEIEVNRDDIQLYFNVRPKPRVYGFVFDHDLNQALAGVTVELRAGDTVRTVETDSSGNYSFSAVEEGVYTISPILDGYVIRSQPMSNVNVVVGSKDVALGFDVWRIPSVEGATVSWWENDIDVPLGGVTIELQGETIYRTTSMATGTYKFIDVEPGTYTIVAFKDGYILDSKYHSEDKIIEVGQGKVGYSFRFHKVQPVCGEVRLGNSTTGVEGVTVELSGDTIRTVKTDQSGDFVFENVVSGPYTVTSKSIGYEIAPEQIDIYVNQHNSSGIIFRAEPIQSAVGIVYGTIKDPSGQPVGGVAMQLDDGNGASKGVTSTSDGSYELNGLPVGLYTINPVNDDYCFEPASMKVKVGESPVRLDITATTEPNIVGGQVLAGIDSPLGGVGVELRGPITMYTTTDADGRYEFMFSTDGEYTITPKLHGVAADPVSETVYVNSSVVETIDFIVESMPQISGNIRTLYGYMIPGVLVELDGGEFQTTLTDFNGDFHFESVDVGEYTVRPVDGSHAFNPDLKKITVDDKNQWSVDFLAVSATSTGVARGTVTDEVGFGISDVEIRITSEETQETVITASDSDGSYRVEDLPVCEYTVSVKKDGYIFDPAEQRRLIHEYATIDFTAIESTTDISGYITDENGLGIAGVTVELVSESGTITVVTDANGFYRFDSIDDGEYVVRPRIEGWTLDQLDAATTIAGQGVNDVNFTATNDPGLKVVSGYITDEGGMPVSGIVVDLRGIGLQTVTTDQNGYYEFVDVSAGVYEVAPRAAGQTYDPQKQSVVAYNDCTGVDFRVCSLSLVSGMVWLGNGNDGLGGVTVELSGDITRSAKTDQSGSFAFVDVASGPYTVRSRSIGYEITPDQIDIFVTEADSGGIIFRAEPIADAVGVVYGSIKDRSGQPVAGIDMQLDDGKGATKSVTSGSDGSYELINLPVGRYTVKPVNSEYCFEPAMMKVSVGGAPVRVDLIATTEPNIIGGQILVGAENPVGGVRVELNGPQQMVTSTDADGFYEFKFSTNGEYTVAPKLDGVTIEPANHKVYVNNSVIGSLDFEIDSLPQISGNICEWYGVGAQNVRVELAGPAPQVVTSDEYGNYSFDNVDSGDYTIKPSRERTDFNPGQIEITVNDSNLWSADFLAVAANSFGIAQGTIRDQDSSALPDVVVKITNPETKETIVTASDSDGYYRVEDLPVCYYNIAVEKDGYLFDPAKRRELVYEGVKIDFNAVAPAVEVSGYIRDENGVPLAGQRVDLVGESGVVSVMTDLNGQYLFSPVDEGGYKVAPKLEGWRLDCYEIDVNVIDQSLAGIDFVATEDKVLKIVSGYIIDEDGQPLNNVAVDLRGLSLRTVTTNDSGYYEFENVKAGLYMVVPRNDSISNGLRYEPVIQKVALHGDCEGINFLVLNLVGQVAVSTEGQGQIFKGAAEVVCDSDGSSATVEIVGTEQVMLTAVPEEGWYFYKWEDDYNAPTKVVGWQSDPMQIKAYFRQYPISHTVSLDGYEVSRSGELGEDLSWVVSKNGNEGLHRNAANETSYRDPNLRPGHYTVYLEKFLNGGYQRCSNVVEYTYGDVDVKNSYQVSIADKFTVVRNGGLGGDLQWIFEKDGEIIYSRDAADELSYLYPDLQEGASYKVWLEQRFDGTVISNILSFTIPDKEYPFCIAIDERYNVFRSGLIDEQVGIYVMRDGKLYRMKNMKYSSMTTMFADKVWLYQYYNGTWWKRVSGVIDYELHDFDY